MAKNFIKSAAMHLCMLFAICLCFTCTSCDSFESKQSLSEQQYQDSLRVVKIVEDMVNPEFYSLEEIDVYRNQQLQYERDKSILLSLPEHVYRNVSTVCMNKHQKANIQLIAEEYLLYKNVYDNLPESTKTPPDKLSETIDSLITIE